MKDIITVVVPVYNAEKWLNRCIKSICEQTYKNLDIILVDDGSKDLSAKICDEYENLDSRIRVFHKKNEGVSAARNDGIRYARGKYLVFIDSDDYIEKDYCSKLYETQMKYRDAWILCGFNSTKAGRKENIKNLYDVDGGISILSKKDVVKIISKWLFGMPWNKLFFVEELRGKEIFMIKDLSLAEDMLFNLEYVDKVVKDKIIIINEGLYNYEVQESGSLDSKYCPNKLEIMRCVNARLYGFCKKNENENMDDYYALALQNIESAMFNNMKKDNPKSYIDKIIENSKIMKSEEYQKFLLESGRKFSLVRRILCKMGNFFVFYIFIKIFNFYQNLRNT